MVDEKVLRDFLPVLLKSSFDQGVVCAKLGLDVDEDHTKAMIEAQLGGAVELLFPEDSGI